MENQFKYEKGDLLKHHNFGKVRMARVRVRGMDYDRNVPFYVAHIIDTDAGDEIRYFDKSIFEEMYVPTK